MDAGDRYVVYGEIARGGMATVHLGRLVGHAGFTRVVAVKRLHPALARDAAIVPMLLDEGRVASSIRHPNVVPTLDVLKTKDDFLLVMEYVHGESLARLIPTAADRGERIAPAIATNVMAAVLHGLHAAHEATDPSGRRLEIVHRDVSPQNILVGADGVARIFDFGIAKAFGRSQNTADGELKGKLGYMSPEQFSGFVTRQSDVYSASVVLWEMLTQRRLFGADDHAANVGAILAGKVTSPREIVDGISPALEAVVMQGLARDLNERFATARDMALALEKAEAVLPPSAISEWVQHMAAPALTQRAALVKGVERADVAAALAQHRASPPDDSQTVSLIITAEDVTTDPREAPKARRRAIALAGLVFAALVLGVTAGVVRARAGARNRSEAPLASDSSAISIPLIHVEGASSTPSAVSRSPEPAADPKPRVPAPSPRPSARVTCSPPYREVLVEGHLRRIPKPECL
jgi:serine/threonine-protein kinase